MSLFVEVQDVEKGCPVIINLDAVVEIAPLRQGGCDIFFSDSAATGGKRTMKVRDNYTQFQQFVMQTVSAEDVTARIEKLTGTTKSNKKEPIEIPKL